MRVHWRYGRQTALRRFLFVVILAAVLLAAASVYVSTRIHPLLNQMAVARASNMVNRIVSEAVNEAVADGQIQYGELIRFERDYDGRIAAVYTDMAVCNRLQSEILDTILAKIEETPPKELSIPVGTLTGPALLAGRGPRLSVRMESAGSSSARFENVFTAAGINQTSHRIVLKIDVSIAILLPGFTTATHVANEVTVAETILLGGVPETYTYFSDTEGLDSIRDYSINKGS